jgi:hypothetical protein
MKRKKTIVKWGWLGLKGLKPMSLEDLLKKQEELTVRRAYLKTVRDETQRMYEATTLALRQVEDDIIEQRRQGRFNFHPTMLKRK